MLQHTFEQESDGNVTYQKMLFGNFSCKYFNSTDYHAMSNLQLNK